MAVLDQLIRIFLGCEERSVRFRTYIFLGILSPPFSALTKGFFNPRLK